jgi:ribonuclease P protein component
VAGAGTRLTGAGAFEALFRHGTRREGRYVQLVFAPASHPSADPTGRHGFVVGRKVLRRAVDRNRFKRVVRERLRARRGEAARYDLVIRLKHPVKREALQEAASEALRLIDRLLDEAPAAPRP